LWLIQFNAVLNSMNFCEAGPTADIVTVSLPDTDIVFLMSNKG